MPGNPNECRTHALECTNLAETALNKNARETFLYFASAWFKLVSQIENSEALVSKWGGQSRLTQLIQHNARGNLPLSQPTMNRKARTDRVRRTFQFRRNRAGVSSGIPSLGFGQRPFFVTKHPD